MRKWLTRSKWWENGFYYSNYFLSMFSLCNINNTWRLSYSSTESALKTNNTWYQSKSLPAADHWPSLQISLLSTSSTYHLLCHSIHVSFLPFLKACSWSWPKRVPLISTLCLFPFPFLSMAFIKQLPKSCQIEQKEFMLSLDSKTSFIRMWLTKICHHKSFSLDITPDT